MVHEFKKKGNGTVRGIHKLKNMEWDNPNKMKFESEHKTFNKQTTLITTGNQIGNTVLSFFVRPVNETTSNNTKFPKGHLQEWDLNNFRTVPEYVKEYVRDVAKNKSVILYQFFYHPEGYQSSKHRDVGYVVTTADHKLIKKFYVDYKPKTVSAVDEATKYIAEQDEWGNYV
jgi:hypothetical protein